ncbi:MAG: cytochrome c family protein [Erythrobacter sp.]
MRKSLLNCAALSAFIAVAACGGNATQEDTANDTAAAAPDAPAAPTTPSPPPAAPSTPDVTEVAFADLTGDAAAGEKVFVKCKTCHVLEDGVNRVGPHLYDVFGRTAGSVEGFNYSPANAESGITWSTDILFDYLEAPQTYLKGTRMAFPGIKDGQERADLIAYLETNGEV